MGGGFTILNNSHFGFEEKIINMLFKVKPDLEGIAKNIRRIDVRCGKCNQNNIVGWEYLDDGELKQTAAATICSNCNNKQFSIEVTTELDKKRVGQLVNNWWYIGESENFGFKNYNAYNNITRVAKETAIAYTQMFSQGSLAEQNLLFMGGTGTGKTHLSKAIARTLREREVKVGFIEATELFSKIRNSYDDGSTSKLFSEIRSLELLIVDDVGVETTKVASVSWTVKLWTEILEARLGLPTIWTTNLDDEGLPLIIGERAASRMHQHTRIIDLYTEDYRKR